MKMEIEFTRYIVVGNDGKWDFAEESFIRLEKYLDFALFSDEVGDYVAISGTIPECIKLCTKHGFLIKKHTFKAKVDFSEAE